MPLLRPWCRLEDSTGQPRSGWAEKADGHSPGRGGTNRCLEREETPRLESLFGDLPEGGDPSCISLLRTRTCLHSLALRLQGGFDGTYAC